MLLRESAVMHPEILAIHSRFDSDPAIRAVPIHQTAAYAFDSADHGAALCNLEEEGFRHGRISTAAAKNQHKLRAV